MIYRSPALAKASNAAIGATLFLVTAAVALVILVGCSGERSLPNGYRWISIYGDSGVIADPNGAIVVDLKVSSTSLKIAGERVTGLREIEQPIGNPPSRTSEIRGSYGRFVLDTKTRDLSFQGIP
jgi:hypothetical protein